MASGIPDSLIVAKEEFDDIESNNTDTSEDSVEVRVGIIKSSGLPPPPPPPLPIKRSKRKSSEPKKVLINKRREVILNDGNHKSLLASAPPKKRFKNAYPSSLIDPEDGGGKVGGPFRPWDDSPPAKILFRPEPVQEEPLALVKERDPPIPSSSSPASKQRNYKNMTPQRRVEANARERQRVHTITNAFDRLQAAIPNHEEAGNKLSKLSVIKIATAYIMVLSRMAGYDYSEDKSEPSIQDCIERCRNLIEAETKLKKRS